MTQQVCANCGKVNDITASFCTQCGKPLSVNQPVKLEDTTSLENKIEEKGLTDLFKSEVMDGPPEPVAPPAPSSPELNPDPGKGETKPESMFPPPLKTDTFATMHMDASAIKDVFCEICKTELHTSTDKYCFNCGAPQHQLLEKCRNCKTPLIPEAKFCHNCGLAVVAIPQITLHMASNDLTFKIPPRAEVFTIGRNVPQQNNFVDLDLGPYGQRRVSRQHARFVLRDNQWLLEDLNSKAGTRIFNDRLTPFMPMPIENDMIIYFAELKFKVTMTE